MKIETGQVIADRFRIESFLGKGGMAEVYKVTDLERSAFLALKMLREELAEDVVFLRRFKREAQTLARLQHPYIVRFYGLEQNERQAFILMDFVEGTTLRKEIFRQQTPFSLERIVEISRAVCSALSFAHNQGLVHCDIKPANIMLHNNGNVLLADFGIARMTESSTSTSLAGAGTPAYMAPEQVRGEVPTPQTDIYSYGIVLYEMATGGERPFTGERSTKTGSTIEKVQWEQLFMEPQAPREHTQAISPALERVILKCLQKDPANRPQTTLELLENLEQALREDSPTAAEEDAPESEDGLTFVPGFSPELPEEGPAVISNTGRSTSRTPARPPEPTGPAKTAAKTPAKAKPARKSRKGLWLGLLLALVLIGGLAGAVYAAALGYFGEVPYLTALFTPAAPASGAPNATAAPLAAAPTTAPVATANPAVTPSPLPVVSLGKIYENAALGVTFNMPDSWTPQENLDSNGYGQVALSSERNFNQFDLPENISLVYLYFVDKASIGNSSNITNDPASLIPVVNGFIDQIQTSIMGVNLSLIGEITPRTIGFFPAARANLKFNLGNFDGQAVMTALLADNRIIVFLGVAHKNTWNEKQAVYEQMVKSIKIKPAKATLTPTLPPTATKVLIVPTQQLTPTATPTTKVDCSNINGNWSGYSVDSKGTRFIWNLRFAQVGCYLDVFISSPYKALGTGQVVGSSVSIVTTFNGSQRIFQFLINRSLLEGYEMADPKHVVFLNSGN